MPRASNHRSQPAGFSHAAIQSRQSAQTAHVRTLQLTAQLAVTVGSQAAIREALGRARALREDLKGDDEKDIDDLTALVQTLEAALTDKIEFEINIPDWDFGPGLLRMTLPPRQQAVREDGLIRCGDDLDAHEEMLGPHGMDRLSVYCPTTHRVTQADIDAQDNVDYISLSKYSVGTLFLVSQCGHKFRPASIAQYILDREHHRQMICPVCRAPWKGGPAVYDVWSEETIFSIIAESVFRKLITDLVILRTPSTALEGPAPVAQRTKPIATAAGPTANGWFQFGHESGGYFWLQALYTALTSLFISRG